MSDQNINKEKIIIQIIPNIISSYKEKPVKWINIGYFYFQYEIINKNFIIFIN